MEGVSDRIESIRYFHADHSLGSFQRGRCLGLGAWSLEMQADCRSEDAWLEWKWR